MSTRPKTSEQKEVLAVMVSKITLLLAKHPNGINRYNLSRFQPSRYHTHVFKQALADLENNGIIERFGDNVRISGLLSSEFDDIKVDDAVSDIDSKIAELQALKKSLE